MMLPGSIKVLHSKILQMVNTLLWTMFDYGCFPIWHKEADLYSINLDGFKTERLDLNSDYSDSYHSWSSNGKWLIFSSKRGDGLTARP